MKMKIEVEENSWYTTSPDIAGFNAFGNLREVRPKANTPNLWQVARQ